MACADTLDDSRERLRDGFVVVGTVVGLRVTGVGSYCHTPQLCMAYSEMPPRLQPQGNVLRSSAWALCFLLARQNSKTPQLPGSG